MGSKSSKPTITSGLTDQQGRVDKLLSSLILQNLGLNLPIDQLVSGGVDLRKVGPENFRQNLGATPYGGQIVPGLIPEYQQSMGLLGGFNPNQFQGDQTRAVTSLLSGKPSYNLDPRTTANWFQNAVVNPSLNTFDTQIAPRIREGFAGVGGFSSRQGTATARALSDLSVQNAGALAQGQFGNQQLQAQLAESAMGRQLQGIGAAQSLINMPLQQALGYQQALSPFQQRVDAQAQSQYQEFLRLAPEANPFINQALGYIGSAQNVAYPGAGGGLGSALSGGLTGASLGSMFGPWGSLIGGGLGAISGGFGI